MNDELISKLKIPAILAAALALGLLAANLTHGTAAKKVQNEQTRNAAMQDLEKQFADTWKRRMAMERLWEGEFSSYARIKKSAAELSTSMATLQRSRDEVLNIMSGTTHAGIIERSKVTLSDVDAAIEKLKPQHEQAMRELEKLDAGYDEAVAEIARLRKLEFDQERMMKAQRIATLGRP